MLISNVIELLCALHTLDNKMKQSESAIVVEIMVFIGVQEEQELDVVEDEQMT